MKPANNAPMYCSIYPHLAEIARKNGYALAVHGSMARDFDLICIPWIEEPNSPEQVVNDFMEAFYIIKVVDSPNEKLHGRVVYTLAFMGEFFFDLSFMPRYNKIFNKNHPDWDENKYKDLTMQLFW